MTTQDRNDLLFLIFCAGYEASHNKISLEDAFKKFLKDIDDAEKEISKLGTNFLPV